LLLPPVFIAVLLVMDVAVPGVAQGSGHLPIIDIVPTSSFTTTSDGIDDDDALSAVSIAGVGRIFPGGGRDLVRFYRGDHATHQNLSPDSLAALPAGLAVHSGQRVPAAERDPDCRPVAACRRSARLQQDRTRKKRACAPVTPASIPSPTPQQGASQ